MFVNGSDWSFFDARRDSDLVSGIMIIAKITFAIRASEGYIVHVIVGIRRGTGRMADYLSLGSHVISILQGLVYYCKPCAIS